MNNSYKVILSGILAIFSFNFSVGQQNENLAVTGAIVAPAPMEFPGGTGVASFIFDASNGATLSPGEEIKISICSSNILFTGPPTGSGVSLFTWAIDPFASNCYVGTRTTNLPQLSGGVISLPYTVTGSSISSNPGNGIDVNLFPHSRDPSAGDSDDNTYTRTYTVSPVLSTVDNSLDSSISVYPNPVTNNLFYLNLSALNGQLVDVKLFDVAGKLVSIKPLANNMVYTYSTKGLQKGLYFLKISHKNSVSVKKIIIN